MAITVICPGCMTRFQVGDQFAGKKGPCPKCGSIIEIPKEKLVIHAPEDITSDGKKIPGGSTLRPYSQRRFIFTSKQVYMTLLGVAVVFLITFLLGRWGQCPAKNLVGLLGVFGIGFPLTAFGYMLVRDEDDLEILLGRELYKRSAITAGGFAFLWLGLELLVAWMGSGMSVIIYIIPIAILAAILAMVVFDTNFAKAIMLFLLVAFAAIFLRGFYYTPVGWIWQTPRAAIRAVSHPNSNSETAGKPDPSKTAANKTQVNPPAGNQQSPADANQSKPNADKGSTDKPAAPPKRSGPKLDFLKEKSDVAQPGKF